MFLKENNVTRPDGKVVTYLYLVESVRVPGKKTPRQKLIHSFGPLNNLNRESLYNLAFNILSYLGGDEPCRDSEAELLWARSLGVPHLVSSLAGELGLVQALQNQLLQRQFEMPVLDAILGMLVNRLDAPCAKSGVLDFLQNEAFYPPADNLQTHHFYRALDFLEEAKDAVEDELFWRTRDLFNRQVDLVFYDSTSTYVEGAGEDDLLQYGYSRDHRCDRKQIVIGLATDREGLPLASAVFPGNTMDAQTVALMRQRVSRLKLGRIVLVCDRGMVSQANLQDLQGQGYDYLVGVKLRQLTEVREQVLCQPGAYRRVEDNLQVKEVFLDDKRYIICLNPAERKRERHIREERIAQLKQELAGCKDPAKLLAHPKKKRYLKRLKTGEVRLDHAAIKADARFDGKYVLLTSERKTGAGELALNYKGLYRVERAFRDLKHTVDIRPLHHWTGLRIKAHVSLCVLAYFFQRWTELRTGRTWADIHRQLKRIQAIKILLINGGFIRRTNLSQEQEIIYKQIDITEPPLILGH
jgi:transposase